MMGIRWVLLSGPWWMNNSSRQGKAPQAFGCEIRGLGLDTCTEARQWAIWREDKWGNNSRSILTTQDCFGYQETSILPYVSLDCWSFDWGYTESVDWFRLDGHFYNIYFGQPCAQEIFPSSIFYRHFDGVFLNFFIQCLKYYTVQVSPWLGLLQGTF